MSNYVQVTDFSAKDALAAGNPLKVALGSDVDVELAAISTAIATKVDTPSTEAAKAALSVAGAVGFHAVPASDQSGIVSGDWTTVIFATQNYDLGSDYASNTFTAPNTGYYILNAVVNTDANFTEGTVTLIRFYKNGDTVIAGNKAVVSDSLSATLNAVYVGNLTAGDTVVVQFFHNEGSNGAFDRDRDTIKMQFSGHQIA